MTNELTEALVASHVGPEWGDGPWWWVLGWFVLPVLLAVLGCVAIWLVTRASYDRPRAPTSGPGWASPAPSSDPAPEQVRLRYARGEIDRDEFLNLSRELDKG